ncbi:hypothetical protein GA0115233_105442 [Streptomyces sp. DI166]|uniref:hypothetical protein n=1 Tax=Streptomyces sp. DI166 TaxID=1839783 RepID=UPI0007F3E3A6|nr:hypothetical protein [Streptomyces sp. DI166]SBT92964.1 hypothetical protein GA0115233_105442 [Streptomyces sp. DI166]
MSGEGDRTRADLDVIREMGNGLARVKKAFEGLEKLGGKYGEDFGDRDVADKFEDFAGSWEINREKLTEEVAALAKMAKTAAKTYEDIDHALAEAIRNAQDPKSKKKGK